MKKWFLLLMMMVLPLQSLLAEGQFFHVLEETHEHTHVHVQTSLTHDHHHHAPASDDKSAESEHHHHHCPGHCTVVLSSLPANAHPDLTYAEFSPEPTLATSFFNSRIERPNWC
jgi:hypothetical protein